MFRVVHVLAGFVTVLVAVASTAPANAQPVVSLGGLVANYLELRTQADLSHERVLAAEATHAERTRAVTTTAEAERAADGDWRQQLDRFGQAAVGALHGLAIDQVRSGLGGAVDRATVTAAVDRATGTQRALEAAGTVRDKARRDSQAAAQALQVATTDLRRQRDRLAGQLTAVRTALDGMTPDQRAMLGAAAANGSGVAVPPGAARRQAGRETASGVTAPTRGAITSNFGMRWGAMHYGLDIANRIGTPIRSVMDGVVLDAGPASGFGLWVKIKHTDGTVSVYGHINSYSVRAGQRVSAGRVIAEMGNRGESTGPHLHFEIWDRAERKLDPLMWLRGKGVVIW